MKKRIIALLMVMMMMFGMVGCMPPSAESEQRAQTKEILNEINNQIGMPDISNFYEKKMAKEIFELRDDSKLITYAYITNLDGQFIFLGTCVGFGLPYSVQYTNPQTYYNNGATLPQADPNGLYMPEGLSATWLMLVNEETGEREIIYAEPEIVVTQSKLPARLCAEWSLPENY